MPGRPCRGICSGLSRRPIFGHATFFLHPDIWLRASGICDLESVRSVRLILPYWMPSHSGNSRQGRLPLRRQTAKRLNDCCRFSMLLVASPLNHCNIRSPPAVRAEPSASQDAPHIRQTIGVGVVRECLAVDHHGPGAGACMRRRNDGQIGHATPQYGLAPASRIARLTATSTSLNVTGATAVWPSVAARAAAIVPRLPLAPQSRGGCVGDDRRRHVAEYDLDLRRPAAFEFERHGGLRGQSYDCLWRTS